LIFGGVGLWLLAVNWLALGGKTWSNILSYVGIIGGIAYWLVVAGYVFEVYILITIAAGLAAVLGPIWYILVGLKLRKGA
jgi:hypothetical protein